MQKTIERFDIHRGLKFSTYAVWWVRNVIRRAIQNNYGEDIQLPGYLQEELQRLKFFNQRFQVMHARFPTREEIAEHFDVSPEKADTWLSLLRRKFLRPQDENDDGTPKFNPHDLMHLNMPADQNEQTTHQTIATKDIFELLEKIKQKRRNSPAKRRKFYILESYYGKERTIEDIGIECGITKQRVYQILEEILEQLRGEFSQQLSAVVAE